jgi:diaminopimelate epimerase
MEVSFARMNGAGNRFAIIDTRRNPLGAEVALVLAQQIERIDQLLLLRAPEGAGDLFMAIYNRDGSEARACGNGVRCVAWLALEAMKEAGQNKDSITIETLGGLVVCRKQGERVEVNMGVPKFDWADIPLAQPRDSLNIRLESAPSSAGLGTAVNIGNPHIVFFPSDIARFDWQEVGRTLEQDSLFPEGVNVSFARVKDEGLELKVWERGAGATQACGTAACAALVAACRRFPVMPHALPVKLPGGILEIQWRKQDKAVLMAGSTQWEGADSIHV